MEHEEHINMAQALDKLRAHSKITSHFDAPIHPA